jgi:hypothetical protein
MIYLSKKDNKILEIAIVLEETRARVQRNSVLVENTNELTPTGEVNNPCRRRTAWIVEKTFTDHYCV